MLEDVDEGLGGVVLKLAVRVALGLLLRRRSAVVHEDVVVAPRSRGLAMGRTIDRTHILFGGLRRSLSPEAIALSLNTQMLVVQGMSQRWMSSKRRARAALVGLGMDGGLLRDQLFMASQGEGHV